MKSIDYQSSSLQSSSKVGGAGETWKKVEAKISLSQEDLPKRPSSVNYHSQFDTVNSAMRAGNMITTLSKQEFGEYGL